MARSRFIYIIIYPNKIIGVFLKKDHLGRYKWHFLTFLVIGILLGYIVAVGIETLGLGIPRNWTRVPCTDTDGGQNYDVRGRVTTGLGAYDDYCASGTTLVEFYCSGSSANSVRKSCSYVCAAGACLGASPNWTSAIRGMRFDPSYYYGKGYTARTLAQYIADQAYTNGVNTIFVMAYSPAYGAFYPTTYADTAVEGGFGQGNILGELITAAHAKKIKVVAWLPVNNFKKVWDNHPDWRSKKKDGSDYLPVANTYFLSCWHDSFQSWYRGFLEDLLARYPNLDGIEAGEGIVDWYWNYEADYNLAASQKYLQQYPGGTLGDANWKLYRAKGMTRLHEILISVAHSRGVGAYVVQTWTAKPDGHLMTSAEIADGSGFDFDGIMSLADKPDYLMAELMWQQWAAEYSNPTTFNPDWTATARNEFISKVNGRVKALVHVELSAFGSYAPTPIQLETSLRYAATGTAGVDFYDHYQVAGSGAMQNVKNVYSAA